MKFMAANNFYDTIIIGAGLSGLEVYNTLTEHGQKVLLIEAGPQGNLEHINFTNPSNTAFNKWIYGSQDDPYFRRFWKTNKYPHFDTYSGQRQVLGGRSLYWHGVILPIDKWALNDPVWPESINYELNDNWRNSGRGLYSIVTEELNKWSFNQTPLDNHLREKAVSYFHSLGYNSISDVPRAVQRYNNGRWRAYSPLYRINEIENKNRSKILYQTQIEFIKKSFTSSIIEIGISNVSGIITTNNLVLAAGSIENARLVSQLIEPINTFSIQDHIIQGFIALIPKKYFKNFSNDIFSIKFLVRGNELNRSNLFITFEVNEDYILIDGWEMGEQYPSDACKLEINHNSIFVEVGLCDKDKELIIKQQNSLQNLWRLLCNNQDLPIDRDLSLFEFGDPKGTYLELVKSNYRSKYKNSIKIYPYYCPLGTVDHESGTLPLGSLLKPSAELNFFSNIYIVGPAIFPRMGAANPSLTTICLSRKIAYGILDIS